MARGPQVARDPFPKFQKTSYNVRKDPLLPLTTIRRFGGERAALGLKLKGLKWKE